MTAGLGWAFCRYEECSHTFWEHLGGTDLVPFQEGSRISSTHCYHCSVQPAMGMEGMPDGGMDLDQYPGFDLSIPELCHALKIKLSRTRDSRYAYATARPSLFDN